MSFQWVHGHFRIALSAFSFHPTSSLSLSFTLLLSLSPFSCPPAIVRLRLEGQWGVARAEWKLIWIWPWMDTARLQEIHRLFFGLPRWFLSSSVTGVLPCITKNKFRQEQTAAQLVIVLGKMPYWVITKRWSDTSESVQMFHGIKFTIRGNFRLVCLGSVLVNWFIFKKYRILFKNVVKPYKNFYPKRLAVEFEYKWPVECQGPCLKIQQWQLSVVPAFKLTTFQLKC